MANPHLDDNSTEGVNDAGKDVIAHARRILEEDKKDKKAKRRSAKSYFDFSQKKLKSKPKTSSRKKPSTRKATSKKARKGAPKAEAVETAPSQKEFIDADVLPDINTKTAVTLVARDPFCLYAFWDISSEAVEKVRAQIGDKLETATYTLRMFDVTYVDFNGYNANHWFDLDGLHMRSRYIQLYNDNVSFLAEIGVRTEDGGFYPFARSNTVTTPRATISPRCDLIWHEEEENKDPQSYIKIDINDVKARPQLFPRANWQNHTRRITLTHEDIVNYYLQEVLMTNYVKAKYLNREGKEVSEEEEEGGESETYVTIEKSFHPELMRVYHRTKRFLGASELLITEEEALSGSGIERASVDRKDDFYFEIDTELTVTGKTEPDANVYLGNKKIELREDGTFTLQYHLPDGVIPLEFKAQSGRNGQRKDITTSVQRTKTHYRKFI